MSFIDDPNLISAADENEEAQNIAETYDLEKDRAERVVEIMDDYGVDENDAVKLEDAGL